MPVSPLTTARASATRAESRSWWPPPNTSVSGRSARLASRATRSASSAPPVTTTRRPRARSASAMAAYRLHGPAAEGAPGAGVQDDGAGGGGRCGRGAAAAGRWGRRRCRRHAAAGTTARARPPRRTKAGRPPQNLKRMLGVGVFFFFFFFKEAQMQAVYGRLAARVSRQVAGRPGAEGGGGRRRGGGRWVEGARPGTPGCGGAAPSPMCACRGGHGG